MIRRIILKLVSCWLAIGLLLVISIRMVEADARARSGYAARYRPGLMERVSRNRGLPIVSCMVASPHHPIGTWLLVRGRSGQAHCRVTDVPHPRDRAQIIRRGIVVELSYPAARRLCGSVVEPPRACPVRVSLAR